MRSSIKYLAIGLFIGVSASVLAAAAIYVFVPDIRAYSFGGPAPLHQASPTPSRSTSTVTPTFRPLPTRILPSATPSPLPSLTATPDPVQALIDSGGLIFEGPLSNAQQIALYRASLKYVAPTPDDSRRISQQINGVSYGDASNICGPLAIAILRDAGILSPDITPHDFWLLNPYASTDAKMLSNAFPFESYMYYRTVTPINKMDWRSSPLLPGDFLFIWHGSGGNFDHMLVISRVDSNGRTYAVTNYGTPDGFVITEAVLYDPNDPSVGLFHTWTQQRNAILGSTGFGGFELWRRRAP